jgi:hypothetical protein
MSKKTLPELIDGEPRRFSFAFDGSFSRDTSHLDASCSMCGQRIPKGEPRYGANRAPMRMGHILARMCGACFGGGRP